MRFTAHGLGYGLHLTDDGAIFAVPYPKADSDRQLKIETRGKIPSRRLSDVSSYTTFQMRFVGANRTPISLGSEEVPGTNNYLTSSNSITNVPSYKKVRFSEVYDGIDLLYHTNESNLEYDFEVKPYADISLIRLRFEGIEKPRLNSDGDLILRVAGREIVQKNLSPIN